MSRLAPAAAPVAATPEELTPAWLTAALTRDDREVEVTDVARAPVGTGQIGACYRLTLEGTGVPRHLVAKLAHPDEATRALLTGAYRAEVRFYTEIAPTVAVRAPACHYGAMDAGAATFTLLLDDCHPAAAGDQVAGCTPVQARAAVTNLAGLHAPRWCDPALSAREGLEPPGDDEAAALRELYGDAVETFLAGLGHRLAADDADTLRASAAVADRWLLGRRSRFALIHGDYRLDNLLFHDPRDAAGAAPAVTAVDWQTLGVGLPARDLAFFLGTGLAVDDRRAHERALVAAYHAALVDLGVEGHPLEECWDDYRYAALQGPLISVFGWAYGTRTARGDDMFAAMTRRSCAAIRDLDTLELAARDDEETTP